MLYVEGGGLSRGAGMIKLEGIHFISHAFIQSCKTDFGQDIMPQSCGKKTQWGREQ